MACAFVSVEYAVINRARTYVLQECIGSLCFPVQLRFSGEPSGSRVVPLLSHPRDTSTVLEVQFPKFPKKTLLMD